MHGGNASSMPLSYSRTLNDIDYYKEAVKIKMTIAGYPFPNLTD